MHPSKKQVLGKNGKPVIVMMTSDIHTQDALDGVREVHREGSSVIYSRGALEKALTEGYEVYIVSTRTRNGLGPQDAWWQGQVPADRIFLTEKEGGVHAESPQFVETFERLYAALGLKLKQKKGNWFQARNDLVHHGVILHALPK